MRDLYSFTILGVLVVAFSCNSTELRKGTGRRLQSGPWNHWEGWIKIQKRGRAQAHSLNPPKALSKDVACGAARRRCYWTLAAAPSSRHFRTSLDPWLTLKGPSVLVGLMLAAWATSLSKLGCRCLEGGAGRWDPALGGGAL